MRAQNVIFEELEQIKGMSLVSREVSLSQDAEALRTEDFEGIVGRSQPLVEVLDLVRVVASTDSTVLITGETGTGKELIARAIHSNNARCGRLFVTLNCAAIPFDLLESELFGHEKGAFTGAIAQKIGCFEMADTGTLP
jgi:formate hydrogenlyase transcriptional activator